MIGHYVRRFFTSLSRRAPAATDEAWAESQLAPAEFALYTRLSNVDRRHLVQGARMVATELGPNADPVWIRAALLHDVGKFHAHLGGFGRVGSTVLATVLGHDRVRGWADRRSWRGRFGRYETHGEIGAREIRAAGGAELAAVWSEVHHHVDQYTASSMNPEMLRLLARADR